MTYDSDQIRAVGTDLAPADAVIYGSRAHAVFCCRIQEKLQCGERFYAVGKISVSIVFLRRRACAVY